MPGSYDIEQAKLYIVLFLHQTATIFLMSRRYFSCISFYSYIKPQPYPISTTHIGVVYRSIPTSNRNCGHALVVVAWLYIVLFLHQTATPANCAYPVPCCISFYSYIKPQLSFPFPHFAARCISFYSYIKPQQKDGDFFAVGVVYRSIPTSNRNSLDDTV